MEEIKELMDSIPWKPLRFALYPFLPAIFGILLILGTILLVAIFAIWFFGLAAGFFYGITGAGVFFAGIWQGEWLSALAGLGISIVGFSLIGLIAWITDQCNI